MLPIFIVAQSNTDKLYMIWKDNNKQDTARLKAYEQYIQEKYLFSKPDSAFILAKEERLYAQKKGLKKEEADALNILGISQAIQGNYEKAVYYFKTSIELREEIKDINGVANSTNNLGLIFSDLGETEKAIKCFEKSLGIYKKLNNYKGITSSLANIGMSYHNLGNYKQAIAYYSQSLKLSEKKKDKNLIAVNLNNIAIIHIDQKEYDLALEEFKKCKVYFEEMQNDYELASVYGYLGTVYQNKNDSKKALLYFNKGLNLKQKVGDLGGIGILYGNIASIYRNDGDFSKALKYYNFSLKYILEGDLIQQSSVCYNNIGLIHFEKGEMNEALKNCTEALEIAELHSFGPEICTAAESLWKIHKKLGNKGKALEMFEKFIFKRDELKSEENQKAIIQQQFQYQYELKSVEDSLKNAEKQKITNAEIKQQKAEIKTKKTQQILLFGGMGLTIIFSIFIFNRYRYSQKQKKIIEQQKHLVEEKNQEITDSITYAKRIQSAILPQEKLIKEHLPNSFIVYKPKDIVAGDFYWFEVMDDIIFFAAADCTGHGVPGAMVSVVCHNALNRSVKEFNLKMPNQILDKTREIVISEFAKSDEDVKDGMDISLCVFNLKEQKLLWSGAHNPLWILRNQEITEYKADKQPIGRFAHAKEFSLHNVEIQKNDEFYFFTDGFQDQFGGEKGKKFRISQMREMFLSLVHNSMEEKKLQIEKTFETWKGAEEQVDDVCIVGIRI